MSNMNTMLRLWKWGWLLLTCTLFLSCNGTPPRCNNVEKPISHLNAAMEGFDPVMSNTMLNVDPGSRSRIFEPMQQLSNQRFVRNSFITKAREHLKCEVTLKTRTIKNYNEYKRVSSSSYGFAANAAASAGGGFGAFSFEASGGYGREDDSKQSNVKRFFQGTNAQITINVKQCITYEINLSPLYEKPVFTQAFMSALKSLHVAAKDPNSASSKDAFVQFVAFFGTHFMEKTFFGAKIVMEKRSTGEEVEGSLRSSRSECLENAYHARLGGGYGVGHASASFDSSTKDCDTSSQSNTGSLQSDSDSVRIISIGSLPLTDLKNWALTVRDSSHPVFYTLDKISHLFRFEWFSAIPVNGQGDQGEKLNSTAMYEFFEEKSADYCNLVLHKACPTDEKGCGISGSCSYGTTCVNDPNSVLGFSCPVKYGGVIIIGGWDGSKYLSDVESLNTSQPPSLPRAVDDITLSAVGSKLYACGGGTTTCYKLDRSDRSPAWTNATPLPKAMRYHSAAFIGPASIWYVHHDQLFNLDTYKDTFKTHNLPFVVDSDHCAASNTTHNFILGAGSGNSEIWVNTVASNPDQWQKVSASIANGRRDHACLWFDGNVYITGGGRFSCAVEVFNTDTLQINMAGSLVEGRKNHKMIVFDGKPAVIGGAGNFGLLDTIETYDRATMTWATSSRKIRAKKESFGLVQLH